MKRLLQICAFIIITPLALFCGFMTVTSLWSGISNGTLEGRPETGWGFLVAIAFAFPTLILGAIDFYLYKQLKSSISQVPFTSFERVIGIVALVVVAFLGGYSLLYGNLPF
jgi:hypothetical protein